jgi:CRISPR-associated endoribonuclease Cas6
MQFRLTLQCLEKPDGRPPLLPFNYPYRLSGWLYGLLQEADGAYAAFLHDQGYPTPGKAGKTFKLFTFSDLRPARYALNPARGGIELLSPQVEWTVAFYVEKAAETFIAGLFSRQVCRIAGGGQGLHFRVERVEAQPLALAADCVQLRTLSPLVVAERRPGGNDRYLAPDEEGYGPLLVRNLIDKYHSVHPEAPAVSPEAFSYRLLPARKGARSRLLAIKEGSRQETRIRGYYDFSFELRGPRAYLEVGLYGGLGRYNAEGCGCVEVVG